MAETTYYNATLRKYYNGFNQKRLKNRDFSLIASNCNGGAILHDLNLKFNSPFVNLWIKPKDYIKLCRDVKGYLAKTLSFTAEPEVPYPIGLLDDVRIYFQHYKTEQDAFESWNRRKERINYNNLFVLFSDRDGCTYEDLVEFDRLETDNKAVFVHKKYPEIKSAVYIPGFRNEESVGVCSGYRNKYTYKKYYDAFDYVAWFNGKGRL